MEHVEQRAILLHDSFRVQTLRATYSTSNNWGKDRTLQNAHGAQMRSLGRTPTLTVMHEIININQLLRLSPTTLPEF